MTLRRQVDFEWSAFDPRYFSMMEAVRDGGWQATLRLG
jgi:hypothetical protein